MCAALALALVPALALAQALPPMVPMYCPNCSLTEGASSFGNPISVPLPTQLNVGDGDAGTTAIWLFDGDPTHKNTQARLYFASVNDPNIFGVSWMLGTTTPPNSWATLADGGSGVLTEWFLSNITQNHQVGATFRLQADAGTAVSSKSRWYFSLSPTALTDPGFNVVMPASDGVDGLAIWSQAGSGLYSPSGRYLYPLVVWNNDIANSTAPLAFVDAVGNASFSGGLQVDGGTYIRPSAYTCAMSASTSCAVSNVPGGSSCMCAVKGSSAIAGACNVASGVATCTAASSNSQTWNVWTQ